MKVIQVTIEVDTRPEEDTVLVIFPPEAIVPWTLALCMLSRSLAESVTLSGAKQQCVVRLDPDVEAGDRAQFRWRGPDRLELDISPNELDFWEHFFLKYVRDGVAEVELIDLEATGDTGTEKKLFMMLKVPDAAPPVSAEEARRRLGMQ